MAAGVENFSERRVNSGQISTIWTFARGSRHRPVRLLGQGRGGTAFVLLHTLQGAIVASRGGRKLVGTVNIDGMHVGGCVTPKTVQTEVWAAPPRRTKTDESRIIYIMESRVLAHHAPAQNPVATVAPATPSPNRNPYASISSAAVEFARPRRSLDPNWRA